MGFECYNKLENSNILFIRGSEIDYHRLKGILSRNKQIRNESETENVILENQVISTIIKYIDKTKKYRTK